MPDPAIGLPKAAGATENTTFALSKLPFFRPGATRRNQKGPHGPKLMIDNAWLRDRLVAPTDTFPKIIPIQVLRVGRAMVIGLPFEVSAEAGRRIAEAASETECAYVSSLANDHCDYLTTAEEYSAQHYEGASTLFGSDQQQFIAGCVRELAKDLESGPVQDVRSRTFDFTVHRYLAQLDGAKVQRRLGRPHFVEATPGEDGYWEMTWTDVSPGDLVWHEPLVHLEAEDGTVVADDNGWNVGVIHKGGNNYAARWFDPPLGRPGRHRFVLAANGGQPRVSGDLFD